MQKRTRCMPGKRQRDEGRAEHLEQQRHRATEALLDMLEEVNESHEIPITEAELARLRHCDMDALYASPHEDLPTKRAAIEAARLTDDTAQTEFKALASSWLADYRQRGPKMVGGRRRPQRLNEHGGQIDGGARALSRPFNASEDSSHFLGHLSPHVRDAFEATVQYLTYLDLVAALKGAVFKQHMDVQMACLDYVNLPRVLNRAHPHEPTLARLMAYHDEKARVVLSVYMARERADEPWEVTQVHYLPQEYRPLFPCEVVDGDSPGAQSSRQR